MKKQTNITTNFIMCLADNSTALTISKSDAKNIKKEKKMRQEDDEEKLDLEIKKEDVKTTGNINDENNATEK